MFSKLMKKTKSLYRRYILRDPFLLEVARWFRAKGDSTLRLNYPLTSASVVFDLGGYHGDFAATIHSRYGCKVYVFEPVPKFYGMCADRFEGNNSIDCFNYGLSAFDGWVDIALDGDASSISASQGNSDRIKVQTKSVVQCVRELGLEWVDLMKINIEGGEFDVIPALIDSGDILRVRYLQVQFHNFVEKAEERRAAIREILSRTHREMWNYEFVWESWALKEGR